jgi:hypothetical protein
LIAANNLDGVIGKCRIRIPVAAATAFATAGSGGAIPVSPTPRTP